MLGTRVFVAGLTRPHDAALLAECGATYLSCEMYADAPRCVSVDEAKAIFEPLGRGVTRVLHVRGATPEVQVLAKEVGTKHIMLSDFDELHATALEALGLTVYRVHEVPTATNLLPTLTPAPSKKHPAVLTVTSSVPDLTFPWEILGTDAPDGTFIAGAVRPENVCALLTHNPFGILLNEGLEGAVGLKDPDRIALLFDTLANGF
jgi:phosphoribosylanthranilate isomerase